MELPLFRPSPKLQTTCFRRAVAQARVQQSVVKQRVRNLDGQLGGSLFQRGSSVRKAHPRGVTIADRKISPLCRDRQPLANFLT